MSMEPPKDISNRKILALAAVAALAMLGILLHAQILGGSLPPQISRLFMGSSGTSGYMILLCLVATGWGYSVYIRCSDKTIRNYLIVIATLIVLWMLDVLLKYPLPDPLFLIRSYMWYFYYVPMTIIPMLCFFSALRSAALDTKPVAKVIKTIVAAISAMAVLTVLTNNFHHFVFKFDFADPDWSGNYTYGLGYWAVLAWYLVLFISFLSVSFAAARKQLRSAFIPIIMAIGASSVYFILYILRGTVSIGTNFSLVYCVVLLVVLEMALDLGILPSYRWYRDAFAMLPLDLKVLDRNNDVVFQSNEALPVSPAVANAIDMHQETAQCAAFRIGSIPATVFKTYPVHGGTALLTEDASTIEERREALIRRRESLRESNELLERESKIKNELVRLESKRVLIDEIERALKDKTQEIESLLESLPTCTDTQCQIERRRILAHVKLLVAYCKRKAGLVLSEKRDPEFSREQLQLVFSETASDLRSIGVECAALVETHEKLPAACVSLLYDCLYDFALAAHLTNDAVLMLFVHELDAAHVQMKALLETTVAPNADFESLADDLKTSLNERNVPFSISTSPSSASLSVIADSTVPAIAMEQEANS